MSHSASSHVMKGAREWSTASTEFADIRRRKMSKFLFVLIMASGITAAPMAYATSLPECGNSYAFQVHGTEPGTDPDIAVLQYIAGVGQISFGSLTITRDRGLPSCSVTHLEMIYNDNDVLGFSAAPAHCLDNISTLGTGIPCFDGADHEAAPGVFTISQGVATLTVAPSFNWLNGVLTTMSLPMAFNLYANAALRPSLGPA